MVTKIVCRLSDALLLSVVLFSALLVTVDTSFAESCRIDRERSMLNDLVQATRAVFARDAKSCGPGLSTADRQSLGKFRAELLRVGRSAKSVEEHASEISRAFAAHEKELSPLAMAAILSESARFRVGVIQEGLRANPKLARAMLAYEKAANKHVKNRNLPHQGLIGAEVDDRNLEKAAARLKRAIELSVLDAFSKRILEKNLVALQSLIYRNSSSQVLKGGDRAALYMDLLLIPKGMASPELVAASYLGMTTRTGADAKIALQVITKAAHAAGSLRVAEPTGVVRMPGYASAGQAENGAFFCRLSDQLSKLGAEERRNVMTAAIIGGALGVR